MDYDELAEHANALLNINNKLREENSELQLKLDRMSITTSEFLDRLVFNLMTLKCFKELTVEEFRADPVIKHLLETSKKFSKEEK